MPNDETSHRLAGFTSGLDLIDVPDDVRHTAKILLADSVASALFGWTSAETAQVAAAAKVALGPGDSVVVGSKPASLAGAALVNGYLITARSVCDMHQPTLCHVTPVVVPPLLAFGEAVSVDGETFLTALVAGLESTLRIGLGLDYPVFRARGWHTPGVAGPIGGALGAARLLGLDVMESERVMGLAGSQAGGTFASFGTPTIKFHQARAAMSATLAIALSQSGFVGPESILTHPDGGIFPTYSGGGSPRLATEGLGQTWELMNTTVRLWPAAAALQAVLTIVADGDMPRTGDIDHIQVSLPSDNYRMHAAMGWDTRFEATLSARFVTSFVLHGHSMWDLSDESITDSDVIGFADQRVSVAEDADLPQGGVGLRIKSAGAEAELRLLHPRGSPENPATWPDIVEKMHITGDAILGRDQVGAVLETIENIEALADVRTLTRLLSAIRRGSTG